MGLAERTGVGVRGPAFLCAIGLGGDPLRADARDWTRVRAESALGMRLRWDAPSLTERAQTGRREMAPARGALFGVTPSSEPAAPAVVRLDGVVIIGSARLDNPDVVRAWTDAPADSSDLALIGRAIRARGERCVRDLLGDFAIVYWDPATRRILTARDAFGVRALYYREWGDRVAFASRASALTDSDAYDDEYFAETLLNGYDASDRSPFAGVRAVRPGGLVVVDGRTIEARRYWSVREFEPAERADAEESVAVFRQLLDDAVRLRLTGRNDVWVQLSGGVDSSSIVSVAQTLAGRGTVPCGVAGSVTLVDSYDDESTYAREVAGAHGVRNEQVSDYALWQDDDEGPPITDEPSSLYPFWARNRRMCDIMRQAGGRVMLSGSGPDHYLTGNLYFLADWVARGKLGTALPELTRWAILGKRPFWKLAGQNVVAPLLPAAMRVGFEPKWSRPPRWLDRRMVRHFGLSNRTSWRRSLAAPRGRQYAGSIAAAMAHIPSTIDRGEFENGIEMRYPFLYRPLVEFSLRLPRELRTQPGARKWVLRQAVAGALPDRVRTRRDKGGITGRVRASLLRERSRIGEWLRDPIIGQHGWVDSSALRALFDRVQEGDEKLLFPLVRLLGVETWCRARVSQWSVRETAR